MKRRTKGERRRLYYQKKWESCSTTPISGWRHSTTLAITRCRRCGQKISQAEGPGNSRAPLRRLTTQSIFLLILYHFGVRKYTDKLFSLSYHKMFKFCPSNRITLAALDSMWQRLNWGHYDLVPCTPSWRGSPNASAATAASVCSVPNVCSLGISTSPTDAQTCPQFPPFLWNTALIFFMKCCKVFTCTDVLYCASVPLLKVQCYEYHFCTLYNVVELLSNFAAFVCDIDQMTMTQL